MQATVSVPITLAVRRIGTLGSLAAAPCSAWRPSSSVRSPAPALRSQPLRSIAVDRTIWAYGLPFWIDAELPWADETPRAFRRLMIAQDTGSAIVGPARADLFFGSGEAAGARAGAIRRKGEVVVLLAARRPAVKEAPQRPHRLRRLSDEEIALWTEVARGVARRRGATLPTPSKPPCRRAGPRPASGRGPRRPKPAGEAGHAAARADRAAAQARVRPRARRDRRRARPAWTYPGRGASGAARVPPPFAGARREARHRRHRQGRPAGRARRMAAGAGRPKAARPALAAGA